MIICPVCGFRNPDANDSCFRCSALLKRDRAEVDARIDRADAKTRRHFRRQRWAGPLQKLRESRWFQQLNALPDDDRYRFPFTAGLLSIVWPGLGYVYLAQRTKAALVMALSLILIGVAIWTLREPWSNYYLSALLMFWMAVWAESVATALRINGASLAWRHGFALWFAAMFLVGMTVAGVQFFSMNILSLQKITTSSMAPYLVRGERVVFSNMAYLFRKPRRDEVIMFDPPRLVVETAKGDAVSLNIKRYYQRVVGVEGDRIRKVRGQVWRNGEVLTANQLPFGVDVLPDFDLTVPPGRIYAPVTYIPEPDMLAGLAGAPALTYLGEPGTVVTGWDGFPFLDLQHVQGRGVVVVDPPEKRQWL